VISETPSRKRRIHAVTATAIIIKAAAIIIPRLFFLSINTYIKNPRRNKILKVLFDIKLKLFEGLGAHVVLHLAGVFLSYAFTDVKHFI
jgi:hypothetical protein